MTFPIKKRIKTELVIDRTAALYIQNGDQNFLFKLKRSNCWRQRPPRGGYENHNGSLFGMNYSMREGKTIKI